MKNIEKYMAIIIFVVGSILITTYYVKKNKIEIESTKRELVVHDSMVRVIDSLKEKLDSRIYANGVLIMKDVYNCHTIDSLKKVISKLYIKIQREELYLKDIKK